jgi:hypothetical protein
MLRYYYVILVPLLYCILLQENADICLERQENRKKLIRIAGILAKVGTRYLLNICLRVFLTHQPAQ